jgi:CheY-like chemotaxis protein
MALIHVVEDDLALAAFLQEALEEEGYTVVVAHNGAIALEQLATARPDLLLCDLMMPTMDGLTFCQHVQAITHARDDPHRPV